jgi:hypothetical protein
MIIPGQFGFNYSSGFREEAFWNNWTLWENVQMPSSQKLEIWLKPNCTFNCPSGFREEAFWNMFSIGSNVKLNSAVAAILHWTLWEKCFKTLLLWNHLDNWNQTAQEWSLEGSLQAVLLNSFKFCAPVVFVWFWLFFSCLRRRGRRYKRGSDWVAVCVFWCFFFGMN